MEYEANAGQTYMPAQDNTEIELLPYERLQRPDPSQNVQCDLTVHKTGAYTWQYVAENGPVTAEKQG